MNKNGSDMFTAADWNLKKSSFNIQKCRFAYNYNELGMPKTKSTEEDDEDFDDEDQIDLMELEGMDDLVSKIQNLKKPKREIKITKIQKLTCGLLTGVNARMKEYTPWTKNGSDFFFESLKELKNRFDNEEEQMKQDQALNVACSGWDIHPWQFKV